MRRLRIGLVSRLAFGLAVLWSGWAAASAGGSGWSVQRAPRPKWQEARLSALSCVSAYACMAVGGVANSTGGQATLAERWNGRHWWVQETRNPTGSTEKGFSGVSCASASACIAVGGFGKGALKESMLAERWNGRKWSIQPTPHPIGSTDDTLFGVSCTSASACTAVGGFGTSAREYFTLAERWNGHRWSVQPTPNPVGSTDNGLLGVSCTSPKVCTAVGFFSRSTTEFMLAERWNGSRWSIQHSLSPDGYLNGVSCTSARACTAVGFFGHAAEEYFTLVARWNGARWSVQHTPNPTGSTDAYFNGVSCTSPKACTAVGQTGDEYTLAERWNGSQWKIQHTHNPSNATSSSFLGVSCPSTKACAAVGRSQPRPPTVITLAERWNGTP